jgi:RNA polymerase-binding protein DksA
MDNTKAKQLLEARKADLQKIAHIATEQGDLNVEQRESAGDVATDPTELASDTLEREVDLSIRDAAEDSLRMVEAALERVSEGTYGTCARCGEPIPDERLEARPEAEYCVEHQPATAA